MGDEIDTSGPTTIVAPDGMRLVVNGLVLHGRSSYEAQPGDTVSVICVPPTRTPLRELAQAYLAREAARANIDSDTDEWWDASDAVGEAANALLTVLPEGELDMMCCAILAALDAEREAGRMEERVKVTKWLRARADRAQARYRVPGDYDTYGSYPEATADAAWDACGEWDTMVAALPARSGSGTEDNSGRWPGRW